MAEYATPEQLFARISPEPLAFDYEVEDSGLTVRIEGISKAQRRQGIYEEISRLSEAGDKGGLPITHPVSKEAYKPRRSDVVSACWCAACVTAPKMTAVQWLQYGAENSLDGLYERCLVASRLLSDEKEKIPSGAEAAEAEIEEDPLASTSDGTSTASTS